jgi:hypothetical protein
MGVETEVDRIDEDDLEGASRFRRAKSVDIVAAGPGGGTGPGPSSDGVANREVEARPSRPVAKTGHHQHAGKPSPRAVAGRTIAIIEHKMT